MLYVTLGFLLAGLVAGVVSMVGGIDQRERYSLRVRYLNLPTFAAFATVFGVVGYPLVRYTGLSAAAIFALAAVSAGAAAAGMVAIIAGWAVPSASREVKDPRYDLQGHFARVMKPVGAQAGGEIEFEEGSVARRAEARSLDGTTIGAGEEVVIERIEDGIAHVERWTTIAQQLELPT
jgi:membrane protein implicated in regulation of membrane protease activity